MGEVGKAHGGRILLCLDPVPARPFGLIQFGVGPLIQRFPEVRAIRMRDPRADRDRRFVAWMPHGVLNRGA